MKAFIVSLSAMIIMILLITWNSFFIVSATNDLIEMASNLEFGNDACSISEKWEKMKWIICISSSNRENIEVDKYLNLINQGTDSRYLFEQYKILLIDSLEEIRKWQEIAPNTVF